MVADGQPPPGLGPLFRKVLLTGAGALRNRVELLSVEWQEERARLVDLLAWTVGFLFFAMTGFLLLAATIVILCPEGVRPYVLGGFTLLCLVGAVVAWIGVRSLLKREAFGETIGQVKKDRAWLDSFK